MQSEWHLRYAALCPTTIDHITGHSSEITSILPTSEPTISWISEILEFTFTPEALPIPPSNNFYYTDTSSSNNDEVSVNF